MVAAGAERAGSSRAIERRTGEVVGRFELDLLEVSVNKEGDPVDSGIGWCVEVDGDVLVGGDARTVEELTTGAVEVRAELQ